ncbi:hypothetical protein PAM7971_01471 [Pacificibacter marinus]|uniref:Uncharacterized protein n=1 Tax=Pacificibacter marinus TaxID=658057 RepID=A0A1Y5S7Q0_9RHOB|nr:hypothetical protein PAM7971_01471 [Pacificibacter marinus]
MTPKIGHAPVTVDMVFVEHNCDPSMVGVPLEDV